MDEPVYKPKYVSPTSLHLWESDREAFFIKYLSGMPQPDNQQTLAMSVGSAFDAFVKSRLYSDLKLGDDPQYGLDALLKEQVDAEIMDDAREAGKYVFECYEACGAYSSLRGDLATSDETPRFEFTLRGQVEGVPLIGKPDCWYSRGGVQVVLDWKVNGYASKSAVSPKKLYRWCRDTWTADRAKPTRGGAGPHKQFVPMDFHGHAIGAHWLDDVDKTWADQLTIYSWMLGIPVGDDNIVTCIDQIACKPAEPKPLLRVAQHRCRISPFWQHSMVGRLHDCWNTITSGHIFTELTREESDSRCEVLIMQAQQMDDDPLWALVNQKRYRG